MSRAVLAGGVESCSTAPVVRKRKATRSGKDPDDWIDPWYSYSHPPTAQAPAMDMSITVAHNCAVEYGITRHEQDMWSLRSHQRAIKAIDAGSFADEIVPIAVVQADGSTVTVEEDEHPRRSTTLDSLGALKVLHPEIERFTVTAGNSSGINDAASLVALAAPHEHPNPLARVLSWAFVGVPPARTGSGPIDAIPKALALAQRSLRDVTLFEINEAFAAQAIACTRALRLDEEIVNDYGSGISLGIQLRPPAHGCWCQPSTSSVDAAVVSASCRCALAAGWAPPWSSKSIEPADEHPACPACLAHAVSSRPERRPRTR